MRILKITICALAEQICTGKMSHRSQTISKKFLHKTTFSVQLPYIAGHSLEKKQLRARFKKQHRSPLYIVYN